ncbi:Multicopper oxidase family protein [Purpureocillium lavendulum]|uniref:Multicopper oxidase family protein n=1 Tax=Purpureocillium lavendulum TaxID=1247861 RepID=A0AB34FRM3_9HYPO|nr:Multicopper oxidase family protein [Purpureocillium lavendulum]
MAHSTDMRDHDDEEDRGLLHDEDADLKLPPSRHATRGDRKTASERWLAGPSRWTLLGFAVLVTILALPLLGYLGRHALPTVASQSQEGDQLAIRLHPDEHATRSPKTLTFDWNVTRQVRSPDGVEKPVYLVNGAFPGPTIEARPGDRLVVNVVNSLESEGLSIHWHGLRMKGFNRMDGAIGLTQCAIPPGGEFAYDFTIGDDEHGTFWWHSHNQVQRGDGLYGGLVVHDPAVPSTSRGDDALVLIGDWYHRAQADVLAWFADFGSLGNEPVPDSLVVNGVGRYNCSMAVPARPLNCTQRLPSDVKPLLARRSGKPARLRLVNTGSLAGFSMSVDGATLQPVAVDGAASVKEHAGQSVGILYPGERADVLLKWDKDDTGPPRMNIYLDQENFGGFPNAALNPNQTFHALPAGNVTLQEGATVLQMDKDHRDLTTLTATSSRTTAMPARAQETVLLYLKTQKLSHFGNKPLGFVNHTTWQVQTPALLSLNRTSWDDHQLLPFVAFKPNEPVTVDLVINNLDDGAHPIHLHGNSFYVLSSYRADGRDGWGSYNPYEASMPPSGLNLKNPVIKDTIGVPRRGHVVVRLTADNPGLWMLHCHMLVHMGTGMVAGLHVGGEDDLDHVRGIDPAAAKLCKSA